MGLHKDMDKYIGVPAVAPRDPESWQYAWPNTADHNFNFYRLLDNAAQSAIARNQHPDLCIAIVGAGIVGLTAARELFRCGYTDTFLQDVYGIAVTTATHGDPGVNLVSYTWEDDALKVEATRDDATLAQMCLAELDRILVRCENIGQPISPYVDTSKPPVVIHWERQPSYRGCAKLYRERSWNLDYALLTYYQERSKGSGLYFAGEAYSGRGMDRAGPPLGAGCRYASDPKHRRNFS
jgi:hypothetical protein